MPVKDKCDGCHGAKEAAIQAVLGRLRQVPEDLGDVYELVYEFIRKGGKLPVYARWIEGERQRDR